jgi:hypothetical protein
MSARFRDHVGSAGVNSNKLDVFIRSLTTPWVDGRRRRQGLPQMMSIAWRFPATASTRC